MCRILRTCQPKRAVGGLGELDLGEELEQANVQNPSHLSVRTSCRELEELGLGEELEQANVHNPSHLSVRTTCREVEELDLGEELEQTYVQNPSHLSVETSCRGAGRAGSGRRAGAGQCAGSLAPVSRNEQSRPSATHRKSDRGRDETYLEAYPRIRSSISIYLPIYHSTYLSI